MADPCRVALVAMTPRQSNDEGGCEDSFPSYGVRRVAAALMSMQDREVEVQVFDEPDGPDDEVVARIEAFDPDFVGLSVYVWSLRRLLEVGAALKRNRPDRLLVLGGPSARRSMLSLPPHRHASGFVDAVVTGDGEDLIRLLVRGYPFRDGELAAIPGILYSREGAWKSSGATAPLVDLSEVVSPYAVGLMQRNAPGYLETYRGCPLNCLFCEWGVSRPDRVFPEEHILRELTLLKEHGTTNAFNVDAGLNLNAHAFRSLLRAEREVGLFATSQQICEVYPSRMSNEALDFIAGCKGSYVGVGLQSFDPEVCKLHDRYLSVDRLERVVQDLASLGSHVTVEVQIILGLPGDSPKGLQRTVLRALELPACVRVYHCLVLPDALLDRGKPSFDIQFDPETTHMTSCLGWTERDFAETHEWLNRLCEQRRGAAGQWWWALPGRNDHPFPAARGHSATTFSP